MGKKYYAVAIGRQKGIFYDWPDCQRQVTGYPGAVYKSFTTEQQALNYLEQFRDLQNNNHAYVIYTDGSFKSGKMGYAYLVIENDRIIKQDYGPLNHINQDNNIAEFGAILKALVYIYQTIKSACDILINTDSNYAYQQIAMLKAACLNLGWHNWIDKYQGLVNFDLLKYIIWYVFTLRTKEINIDFKHVAAHCGIKYNELADKLANQGRLLA